MVYALAYPIIAINLVNLDNLSQWSDSVHTHTCSNLLRKPNIEMTQDGQNRANNKLVASVE